jgi:nitroimidazol reductase NimA-like FMN-containing flavoprotein (pyridoxamine 5'-phosphate oxidase superfamily)
MNNGNLRDTDALAILRKGNLGRLGCIADGRPYVVAVLSPRLKFCYTLA